MDGILLLEKPKGYSSHDCVNLARMAFNTKKVGHSGTLDKEASGLLVLGINKGTKIMEFLNQDDKWYHFTVVFNVQTDTLDHTGKVVDKQKQHDFAKLDKVLKAFEGPYMQSPPAYSAVKVKGKKLYEYARRHETIPDVAKRSLKIYRLKRLNTLEKLANDTYQVTCEVYGSKGLFVRQLALDIAKKLGTVAHTSSIHRVQAGQFHVSDAFGLSDLKANKAPLISLNDALKNLPAMTVTPEMQMKIQHGQKLLIIAQDSLLKMVDKKHQTLLAIYEKDPTEKNLYRAKKVFI